LTLRTHFCRRVYLAHRRSDAPHVTRQIEIANDILWRTLFDRIRPPADWPLPTPTCVCQRHRSWTSRVEAGKVTLVTPEFRAARSRHHSVRRRRLPLRVDIAAAAASVEALIEHLMKIAAEKIHGDLTYRPRLIA
jgi:hypothetical protein